MSNPALARAAKPGVTRTVIHHDDGSKTVHTKRVDARGVVRRSTVTFKIDLK